MTTTISKWGNSKAVRIPKSYAEMLDLQDNDTVEITTENNMLIITKKVSSPKRKSIQERFSEFNSDCTGSEIDWGSPTGKEVW